MPALGDKNVGGLDVAMDDALFVRGIESVGDLDADFRGFGNGYGTGSQKLVQGLTFKEFHVNVGAAILFFDGVDGADSRMVHGGGRTGFAKESLGGSGIEEVGFQEKFESHATAELGVFRFVDETHAAAAELAKDSIVSDCLVEHEGE